jgi:hypothetical protein
MNDWKKFFDDRVTSDAEKAQKKKEEEAKVTDAIKQGALAVLTSALRQYVQVELQDAQTHLSRRGCDCQTGYSSSLDSVHLDLNGKRLSFTVDRSSAIMMVDGAGAFTDKVGLSSPHGAVVAASSPDERFDAKKFFDRTMKRFVEHVIPKA